MAEIYEHKKHLYAISDHANEGFIVTKASVLADGKKSVEDIRKLKVKNTIAVKRAIRTGKYETFEKMI